MITLGSKTNESYILSNPIGRDRNLEPNEFARGSKYGRRINGKMVALCHHMLATH